MISLRTGALAAATLALTACSSSGYYDDGYYDSEPAVVSPYPYSPYYDPYYDDYGYGGFSHFHDYDDFDRHDFDDDDDDDDDDEDRPTKRRITRPSSERDVVREMESSPRRSLGMGDDDDDDRSVRRRLIPDDSPSVGWDKHNAQNRSLSEPNDCPPKGCKDKD